MEYILLVLVAVIAYLNYSGNKQLVPATAADWFVVFDIDAAKKVLTMYFYPVVGFRIADNNTEAITSRPDFTKKAAARRPAVKDGEGVSAVSVSYGRWCRDGVMFDERGNPELSDGQNFMTTVEGYLLSEFKVWFATPVPEFYSALIAKASTRAKAAAS